MNFRRTDIPNWKKVKSYLVRYMIVSSQHRWYVCNVAWEVEKWSFDYLHLHSSWKIWDLDAFDAFVKWKVIKAKVDNELIIFKWWEVEIIEANNLKIHNWACLKNTKQIFAETIEIDGELFERKKNLPEEEFGQLVSKLSGHWFNWFLMGWQDRVKIW